MNLEDIYQAYCKKDIYPYHIMASISLKSTASMICMKPVRIWIVIPFWPTPCAEPLGYLALGAASIWLEAVPLALSALFWPVRGAVMKFSFRVTATNLSITRWLSPD